MPVFEHQKLKTFQVEALESKYCFRYSLEDRALEESVNAFGILAPVYVIQTDGGRFGLIGGFKRFYAALKLKIQEIPALILQDSLPEKELVRMLLSLNWNEALAPLDQAVAVKKLVSKPEFSKEEVREVFLPLLGLPPSPKVLEEYEKISGLIPEIVEALHQGEIPFRGISEWADFSSEDQRILWTNGLKRFHFTSSELVEFASLVEDLISMKNQPAEKIFENPDIQELIRLTERSKEKQKVQPLMDLVRRLRYPRSYEERKKFREQVSRMKFKSPIQLLKSDSMEEEGLELNIRLLNRNAFGKVLEELRQKQAEIEGLL